MILIDIISVNYIGENCELLYITTPSSATISIAFFSNDVVHDFQENYDDEDEEEVSDDEEVTHVNVLMALADDELTIGKNHAQIGEWIDITMRKVERLNPYNKLQNFNTKGILVPEIQAVNEYLKPTKTSTNPESSKDSEAESLNPLPPLKNLQGASLRSKVDSLTFQPHSPKERLGSGIMKHTNTKTQDSLNKSVSGTVTVSKTEPTTPLVSTEVKKT
uniref:Retrovirus-related Pol polyprotein from transposon TNT 1-94 n=1 Tax=Tanacetum cinerariifolium TaxID=118510 RepID=A0A6L2NRR1_TANCI|nr:hypothetical protein [Tanacetum cinerariifolium]